MSAQPVVRTERRGRVALIRLERPEARNAINAALASQLVDAMAACQDAGAIVITGADPAFCAGLDLRDLGLAKLTQLAPFSVAVRDSKVPVIAAVNGAAVTGGFEIALASDFMIASERAVFADTHLRVGVYPGPVLVDLPRRVGIAKAREMSLTGNFVDAVTALRIGLVNHVVAHEELLPFTLAIADAIAEQDPAMVSAMRRDWDVTSELPVLEAHDAHAAFAADAGFRDAGSDTLRANADAVFSRSKVQRATG
ncbi:MAG: enoyl-CoA hydratase/carnithine racemase [Ilumatobacteraceae bacterium]|nr:enoyl-CoA hydratase/carnithine racemase [Ilumatobacteraceae bacterium]